MSDIEDQGSFRASRSIPTEREDGAASVPMLERLSLAIAEALDRRTFCLYDYSAYPEVNGGLKAHVVRDEWCGGKVVFESDSPREAREFYERESRLAIARAALEAIREPSEEAVTAMVLAPVDLGDCSGGNLKRSWRHGVDAILQGKA